VAKAADDQVPFAAPSARRRSDWTAGPSLRRLPPRTQISLSGKVVPGVSASVGPQSCRPLEVMRCRLRVPPIVAAWNRSIWSNSSPGPPLPATNSVHTAHHWPPVATTSPCVSDDDTQLCDSTRPGV
jgi:hypothetical protein